ncbi:MAG TPA: hypothetical protein VLY85_02455, partial [Thermoplasmata archaeon]|nr:hypothetical protein [Thermoplasmata archaeon]
PGRHRTRGAAIVQSEVRRLHGKVLSSLIDAGAVPFSIPPSTHARNRSGRLETLDAGPFERALDAGGWPVSFGDVVPDAEWGFSILSADAIATELARRLRPARVVFVSDVPGILEPGTAGRRKVVEAVTPEIVAQLGRTSAGPDVTGGIRGKAEAMLAIAADGADAVLISGLTDGALLRAVRGEAVYGSWSRASPRDR